MTDKAYEIKIYLRDLQDFEIETRKAKSRLDNYDCTIGGQISRMENTPRSSAPAYYEDKLYKREKLIEQYNNALEKYAEEMRARYILINTLQDSNARALLLMRFILGKDIKTICKEMELSKNSIILKCKAAFEELAANQK